jgi:molybdenum-dependent DNA-binding transcriptional regulator ModE
MEPKVKIWVAFDSQTKFGEGRAQLLESIDRVGSIKNAVEQCRSRRSPAAPGDPSPRPN